jgi:hypothetical protein
MIVLLIRILHPYFLTSSNAEQCQKAVMSKQCEKISNALHSHYHPSR